MTEESPLTREDLAIGRGLTYEWEFFMDSLFSAVGAGALVSQRAIAMARANFTVTPGDPGPQLANLDSGLVQDSGEDYWGEPGTALPLDLDVVDGLLTYPEDSADHIFDVQTSFVLNADAADAGKLVVFRVHGNDGGTMIVCPVDGSGLVEVAMSWVDRVFLGEDREPISATVDVSALTLPFVAANQVKHVVMQR